MMMVKRLISMIFKQVEDEICFKAEKREAAVAA